MSWILYFYVRQWKAYMKIFIYRTSQNMLYLTITPFILLFYNASRLYVGVSKTNTIFTYGYTFSLLSYKANKQGRCEILQQQAVRVIMAHINIIKRTAQSNSVFCLHRYFCSSALTVAHVPLLSCMWRVDNVM
jgi:hypothetical protein